jgi:[NiFe] hydrogenase assembly HybE family chaperone
MTAEAIGQRLAARYRDIEAKAMRDVPICNGALEVEAIGFREFSGYVLGVMITPWFLSLAATESQQSDAPRLQVGDLRLRFPAGAVDFLVSELDGFGTLASCSLFSPMFDFTDQETARAAAKAALDSLFDPNLHAPSPARRGEPRSVVDRRDLFFGRKPRKRAENERRD